MMTTQGRSESGAVPPDPIGIAADRLLQGGLVAFPTETVYGLGADAENENALAAMYAAKGRPANHPVIVHLAPHADVKYWAKSVPDEARALMRAFWPGPLTLILMRADHISPAVSGGQESIGLRCPSHPVAQALLGRFAALKPHGQGGVAAPSANKFGHVSPTRATHVRDEFPDLDDSLLLILEGGASEVGVESTIVDLSRLEQGVGPVLLRPGHITAAQIGTVLGRDILRPDAAAPQVSGSLKAHYAPRTPLALLTHSQMLDWIGRADPAAGRFAVVVFGAAADAVGASRSGPEHVEWHIASADPQVYARELYALLRRLDRQGYAGIAIERPPQEAAWQAINDRLGRAAAAFE